MYTVLDTTILALREQLEVKDRQIAAKDQQLDQQAQTIMRLTDALAAAQQTGSCSPSTSRWDDPASALRGCRAGYY